MNSMSRPEKPLKEFVGFIWIEDEPGLRLRVMARTAEEAWEAVIVEHGEGHVISLWNEDDASRPRSAGTSSERVDPDPSDEDANGAGASCDAD